MPQRSDPNGHGTGGFGGVDPVVFFAVGEFVVGPEVRAGEDDG